MRGESPQGGRRGGEDLLHRAGKKPGWGSPPGRGQSWRHTLEIDSAFILFHILNDKKHFKRGRGASLRASWQGSRGFSKCQETSVISSDVVSVLTVIPILARKQA